MKYLQLDFQCLFISISTTKILRWLLWPLFWWQSQKKKTSLPPIDKNLLLYSATNLADKIRKRMITSEQVVKTYIHRIKQVNPILNAVVEDRFNDAIEDAIKVDEYILESTLTEEELKQQKPLLGIPVTIKESFALKDFSLSVGCLPRAGIKAKEDCAVVRRLIDVGAIPLLISNTPEYCLHFETTNYITGTTCNCYDPNYTSGGSSGGEAALMGAGASIIGIGTDLGGSVRIPAMFNGVFGHKSSPNLISSEGMFPICPDEKFLEYFSIGPITRYAEDLKLMMAVLCDNISKDIKLQDEVDISKLTVYYMDEILEYPFLVPVQREIKDAITKVVSYLGNVCHCNISDYKFQALNKSFEINLYHMFALKDVPNVLENIGDPKTKDSLFREIFKSMFGVSKYCYISLLIYFIIESNMFGNEKKHKKYVNAGKQLKQIFLNKLKTSGVFIYPTFAISAFRHGEGITRFTGLTYAMIFNVLGFPATQVPLGLGGNGMPIGMQVVAAPNQDRLCLAVAAELEKKFGGWIPPS